MKYKVLYIVLFFISFQYNFSQELNANVSINYDRMTDVNPQIFKNLENQVKEFLNTTKWTNKEYLASEKITCNFFINISAYKSNNFEATLQVQSSRPIFNSTYESPILNLNDKDFSFRYIEFEQFIYDQNTFNSNLISVLAFYTNIIIGLDMDSFKELDGTFFLEVASNIANVSQSSGYKGWSQAEGGNTNRYFLISDLLSSTFRPYRIALHKFHSNGLDYMAEDLLKGKNGIAEAIETISEIQKVRPNALLTRTFFDAKTDEIVSIFSGGPFMDNANLIQLLNRISPLNSVSWNKIK
uniref:type IX secretion system protein PorD n=1 Tax=Flavobacterium sp. TaxID=239 RepID=UPI00404A4F80